MSAYDRLSAALERIPASVEEMRDALRFLNDAPDLDAAFETLKAIARIHGHEPDAGLANEFLSLRTALASVAIDAAAHDMAEERWKALRAARGNLYSDIDDVLRAAADLGIKPEDPAQGLPHVDAVSRKGRQGQLNALEARLRAIETVLDERIAPEGIDSPDRPHVQVLLVRQYLTVMQRSSRLFHVTLNIGDVVDLAALERLVATMARATQEFGATVLSTASRATDALRRGAEQVRRPMARLARGLGTIVRATALAEARRPAETEGTTEIKRTDLVFNFSGMRVRGKDNFSRLSGRTQTISHEQTGSQLQIGDILNNTFLIERRISRGGMGQVFLGRNLVSDELVAIKTILPELTSTPEIEHLFRREGDLLSRLHHPGIANYRLFAQEPKLGVSYLVTEYVDGVSLQEVLGDLRPNTKDIQLFGVLLADALDYMHQAGFIHGDVKPANILLKQGDLHQPILIDFGSSGEPEELSNSFFNSFTRSVAYAAPEQSGNFRQEIGPWTDVYSLGVVLAAVALGHAPWKDDVIIRGRGDFDLLKISRPLREILRRMLAPRPRDRPQSMAEVGGLLRR